MAKRTDRHAPGNMDPSDYVCVHVFEIYWFDHPVSADESLISWWKDMREKHTRLRRDPRFRPAANGGCKLCGQTNYNSGAIFRHKPTGELIELGWKCAEKVELHYSVDTRKALASARKKLTMADRERADRLARLRAFVSEHKDDGLLVDLRTDNKIIRDIRAKVARHGLSEKQIALVRKLARERPQEPTPVPIPKMDGRVTIDGTVLGTKQQDTDYGTCTKMLVRVEQDGGAYKLWGTVPDSLFDPEAGDLRDCRVTFCARVNPSKDDPCFGFFSRPTNAKRIGSE